MIPEGRRLSLERKMLRMLLERRISLPERMRRTLWEKVFKLLARKILDGTVSSETSGLVNPS
jgi:hypothetical protein